VTDSSEAVSPIRVVLIGAESTGKTMLARSLAEDLEVPWVPEYARQYLDQKRAPLSYEDVEPIARGQMAGEDEAQLTDTGLLILDTDLVSTTVYARYYYGSCPLWIEKAALERKAPLYLLLHPDVPWVADGAQRDRPNDRQELHERFRGTLDTMSAHVVDVRGAWAARAHTARDAIQALASTHTIS
jgi:NadR type nicotinamide-nucleotide adenylyltransferase